MAYMNQEKKAKLAPGIKAVLAKYNMKATLAVQHHMALVVNIKPGPLDIIANYLKVDAKRSHGRSIWDENVTAETFKAKEGYRLDVNPYSIDEHYSGKVKSFLTELYDAANVGNHNRSDLMTDYFDVGWYLDINVYQLEVKA